MSVAVSGLPARMAEAIARALGDLDATATYDAVLQVAVREGERP